MVWQIVAGFILAIVFGPAILAFLKPATTRSSTLCFIFGGLQIALGVTLYLMIYAGGGVDWPWLLLIALLGVYYVSRGTQFRRPRTRAPDCQNPET
jgi:hypothetical protein